MLDGTSVVTHRFILLFSGVLVYLNLYAFGNGFHDAVGVVLIVLGTLSIVLGLLYLYEIKNKKGILDADVTNNNLDVIFSENFADTYSKYLRHTSRYHDLNNFTNLAKSTFGWAIDKYISDVTTYYNAAPNKDAFINKYQELSKKHGIENSIIKLMDVATGSYLYGTLPYVTGDADNRFLFLIEDIPNYNGDDKKEYLKNLLDEGYDLNTGLKSSDIYGELKLETYNNRVVFAKYAFEAFNESLPVDMNV